MLPQMYTNKLVRPNEVARATANNISGAVTSGDVKRASGISLPRASEEESRLEIEFAKCLMVATRAGAPRLVLVFSISDELAAHENDVWAVLLC